MTFQKAKGSAASSQRPWRNAFIFSLAMLGEVWNPKIHKADTSKCLRYQEGFKLLASHMALEAVLKCGCIIQSATGLSQKKRLERDLYPRVCLSSWKYSGLIEDVPSWLSSPLTKLWRGREEQCYGIRTLELGTPRLPVNLFFPLL